MMGYSLSQEVHIYNLLFFCLFISQLLCHEELTNSNLILMVTLNQRSAALKGQIKICSTKFELPQITSTQILLWIGRILVNFIPCYSSG
jgi:hypothetical protein